ncbi:MAG: hypothetical protein MI923_22985 [Phycisphaerales bacterium]|nr:hypothetical protein [Phycisphaerales bacterium]
MKTKVNKPRCAVRLADSETDMQVMNAYLEANELAEAVRFLSKDDDDLNADVCAGHFEQVVFFDLDALLSAIWKDDIEIDRWLALKVRIDLASVPGTADWHNLLPIVADSFKHWQGRQRRRQIIASIILSVIALAALAILFFLIPPAT